MCKYLRTVENGFYRELCTHEWMEMESFTMWRLPNWKWQSDGSTFPPFATIREEVSFQATFKQSLQEKNAFPCKILLSIFLVGSTITIWKLNDAGGGRQKKGNFHDAKLKEGAAKCHRQTNVECHGKWSLPMRFWCNNRNHSSLRQQHIKNT